MERDPVVALARRVHDDLPVHELRAREEAAGEKLVEGQSFGGDGHAQKRNAGVRQVPSVT
jgi:hypothetical protein